MNIFVFFALVMTTLNFDPSRITSQLKVTSQSDKNIWMNEKCRLLECNAKVLAQLIPLNLEAAIQETRIKTKVPLVIPLIDENLFGEVGYVSKNVFGINFSKVKDCRGTRGCTYGFIEGEIIHQDSLSGIQLHKMNRHPEKNDNRFGNAQEITLAREISGFYLPPSFGAYLGPGFIFWRQGGVQYRVGIYDLKSLQELIEMANSAIENQF
ncbi:hypothetical protein FEV09_22215 [Pseudanabaena catenata USMAC16]|uniref:Uncharacterized protein n=3 Tax=Pseudanabaena TaxID=1152 RepID=L8MVH2_9CYAN|nr:hypothetical protein [Pseudanabaena catenata]ELS30470.1 hypothetical protein Pse7429DRAFT_4627 [Pseudanabaena biceps PCC 7429]MDG3497255.1 hypothetical protein [Pseudanabaena catenata USMAC16]